MKYVIVYNEKEIVFEGEVPDNTITYYPDKGYYCKVFDVEEKKEDYKKVVDEALIQKRIEVECVSCYKEWLDKAGLTYSTTASKEELKQQLESNLILSTYPADKKIWTETVDKTVKEKQKDEKK